MDIALREKLVAAAKELEITANVKEILYPIRVGLFFPNPADFLPFTIHLLDMTDQRHGLQAAKDISRELMALNHLAIDGGIFVY